MTGRDVPAVTAALAPLREELLRRARTDADRVLAQADAAAAAVLADARIRAQAVLAEATAQGEADAAAVLAAQRAQARRAARTRELAARRLAYEELRDGAVRAVSGLLAGPGAQALCDRLAAMARSVLGPDAAVADEAGGGLVAQAPGRRLDLTPAVLVACALDRLGAEVEGMWTP